MFRISAKKPSNIKWVERGSVYSLDCDFPQSLFQTLQHSWATCGVIVVLSECAYDMSRLFCSVKLRAYSQRPCSPSHSELAWKTWSEMRLIRSTRNNGGMKDTYELPLYKTSGQKKLSHVKLLCKTLCAAKWEGCRKAYWLAWREEIRWS